MSQPELKPSSAEFPPDEAELARRLAALRRMPSSTLRHRVQAIPRPNRQARAVPHHLIGGVIALLVVALLFASPPAKATLDEVQKIIGQIHLTLRSVWPKPTETVVPLETELTTLAEAKAKLPFNFTFPSYLPEGLSASNEISVAKLTIPMAKMEWRDAEGGFVQLTVAASDQENQLSYTLVGPDSSKPILINGQEAVLVRGGWDGESRTWSYQDQIITLIWTVEGIQYRLLAYSRLVPLTELIAMAESIHPDEVKP